MHAPDNYNDRVFKHRLRKRKGLETHVIIMTSRFTMFCTLCGRNPLKSRRVTPRLLKRLGYFQQQSQKYELTLRLHGDVLYEENTSP